MVLSIRNAKANKGARQLDHIDNPLIQNQQGGVIGNIKSKVTADYVKKYSVLAPKDQFYYEYDFGSTTYLDGQEVGVREGNLGQSRTRILARNNPYDFACENCGQDATGICVNCERFVCDPCQDDQDCGEEMILPVVNSPRMGVWGYAGTDPGDNWSPSP